MISGVSLALLVATAPTAASAESKRRPYVAVTQESPVVVVGRAFATRERITVRVTTPGRSYARVVRATPAGTFRTTFAEADVDCANYTVTARGASGRRAMQTRSFEIPPPCGIAGQR